MLTQPRASREKVISPTKCPLRIGECGGFLRELVVINDASDFLVKVFGDAGKHARAAVATNGLPRGTTVEVRVVVEVRD